VSSSGSISCLGDIIGQGLVDVSLNSVACGSLFVKHVDDTKTNPAITSQISTAQETANTHNTLGFQFTPTVDMVVTDVGFISGGYLKVSEGTERQVGMWRVSDQEMLFSTNLELASPVVDGYIKTPSGSTARIVTLYAGVAYRIGIEVFGDDTTSKDEYEFNAQSHAAAINGAGETKMYDFDEWLPLSQGEQSHLACQWHLGFAVLVLY